MERIFRRRMQGYEAAWKADNLPAIVDALNDCAAFDMAPPPWLVAAVATLVERQMLVRRGRGAFNYAQAVFDENEKHLTRWEMVRDLMDCGREIYERFGDDRGLTLEKARAAVSEQLKGTPAEGGEDTVKRSYDLIERRMAQGEECYIPSFKPNVKRG